MVTAGLGVVNPVLIRVVFDSALFPKSGGPDLDLLWLLGGIMAGITVITGGLGIVQTYLTNMVGQRVMRDLRDTLYRHLQSLSLGFLHRHPHWRNPVPGNQRRGRRPAGGDQHRL